MTCWQALQGRHVEESGITQSVSRLSRRANLKVDSSLPLPMKHQSLRPFSLRSYGSGGVGDRQGDILLRRHSCSLSRSPSRRNAHTAHIDQSIRAQVAIERARNSSKASHWGMKPNDPMCAYTGPRSGFQSHSPWHKPVPQLTSESCS